jgi:hypothetical protein
MHSTKQEGSREQGRNRGKRVASASTGQRTGQKPKSLRKHVRFADPFHQPGWENATEGLRMDRRFTDVSTGIRKPVRIRKELRASVKRVGAIQVFCPKASKAENLSANGYRLSRIFDDVSLCQNPYFGRRTLRFQVATAYKTKANKVRPVDPGETDGSKPGGCLDWLERSKADDVPSRNSGQYSDWVTPKFSDIQKGSRLTEERIEDLVVGGSLWPRTLA